MKSASAGVSEGAGIAGEVETDTDAAGAGAETGAGVATGPGADAGGVGDGFATTVTLGASGATTGAAPAAGLATTGVPDGKTPGLGGRIPMGAGLGAGDDDAGGTMTLAGGIRRLLAGAGEAATGLTADSKPKTVRPAPPGNRGHPPSLDRPRARRPWRDTP